MSLPFDAIVFNGRYRTNIRQEIKYAAQQFPYEVERMLRKIDLRR